MSNAMIWIPKRLVELGLLNVAAADAQALVDYCEADYAARIEKAAAAVESSGAHVVMLTGPSSSGKTTTHKIAARLKARGVASAVVSLDNFFKDVADYPLRADGTPDYESVDALDIARINRCLLELVSTGRTDVPDFDFRAEHRHTSTFPVEVGPGGVAVVEGIHALNPRLTALLPGASVFRIYAGLREEYSHRGQRILPTRDIRLARRMVRDSRFRGHSPERTLQMWPAVCEGEDRNIKVFKPEADLLLDTSFSCEPGCLAPLVDAMARAMRPDSPFYAQTADLARRFALAAPIATRYIPEHSMLREFFGPEKG